MECKCMIFSAPRPECTTDPECPNHLACVQEKCQDPCYTHSCGRNAECKAKNHRAICVCIYGYVGDPYTLCEERKITSFPFSYFTILCNVTLFCGSKASCILAYWAYILKLFSYFLPPLEQRDAKATANVR